jgi:hypothetical protein
MWPPNGYNCRCQPIPLYDEAELRFPPTDGSAHPDPGWGVNVGVLFGPLPKAKTNPVMPTATPSIGGKYGIVLAHSVTSELRDKYGKWSKTGSGTTGPNLGETHAQRMLTLSKIFSKMPLKSLAVLASLNHNPPPGKFYAPTTAAKSTVKAIQAAFPHLTVERINPVAFLKKHPTSNPARETTLKQADLEYKAMKNAHMAKVNAIKKAKKLGLPIPTFDEPKLPPFTEKDLIPEPEPKKPEDKKLNVTYIEDKLYLHLPNATMQRRTSLAAAIFAAQGKPEQFFINKDVKHILPNGDKNPDYIEKPEREAIAAAFPNTNISISNKPGVPNTPYVAPKAKEYKPYTPYVEPNWTTKPKKESPQDTSQDWHNWNTNLPSDERNAIAQWKDGQYRDMQKAQIGGSKYEYEIKHYGKAAALVEAGLAKGPVYNKEVWRGIRVEEDSEHYDKYTKVGDVFHWKMTQSASRLNSKGAEFAQGHMCIHFVKQSRGVDVQNCNGNHDGEREVILRKGGHYRVLSVEKNVKVGNEKVKTYITVEETKLKPGEKAHIIEWGYGPLVGIALAAAKKRDVSAEKRDKSGKWTIGGKTGEAIKDFVAWFTGSKVVTEDGKPLRVYHGTQRPDRIANKFLPERATSGPMAFFTDDPDIASSYATGKRDTSLEMPEDYAEWIKYKGKNIDKAWYSLSTQQRAEIADKLPRVSNTDDNGDSLPDGKYQLTKPGDTGVAGKQTWDWEIKNARGNVLKAAKEIWLAGGVLFNQEEEFLKVLELGGLPGAELHDPNAAYSAIYPVYLSIKNPLDTSEIPKKVISDLRKAAKLNSAAKYAAGADAWDKNTRSGEDWISALDYDLKDPKHSTLAWTSIPDWVTDVLKKHKYDGIQDKGGKYGGKEHTVWIPFTSEQVKSATANKGSYAKSADITLANPHDVTAEKRDTRGKWAKQTDTAEFKDWFGHGAVVDENGKPLRVYHGTMEEFTEFDREAGGNYKTLDQMLGSHFAKSDNMAESFAFNKNKGWAEPRLENSEGGNVLPVYLNLQHPKVIEQKPLQGNPSELTTDAVAINADIIDTVFPNNKDLFIQWVKNSRNINDVAANKVWDALKENKSVDDKDIPEVAHFDLTSKYVDKVAKTTVGKYVSDFDSQLMMLGTIGQRKAVVNAYRDELQKQGYDGIQYQNTAPMETKYAPEEVLDNTVWIAFSKEQIKSATGNKGTWSKKTGDINLGYDETEKRNAHGEWTKGNGIEILPGHVGGSTGAKAVKLNGDKYIMKQYSGREDQARNEYLANSLYNKYSDSTGAPKSILKVVDGKVAVLSPFVSGLKLFNERKNKSDYEALGKNFVLDAWLANWDVVGTGADNAAISSVDNSVHRLDNGGALIYRAQGGLKGKAFGPKVGELETLRDSSTAYDAAKVFQHLSDDDVKNQIKALEKRYISNGGRNGMAEAVRLAGFDATTTKHITDTLDARMKYLKTWKGASSYAN